MTSKYMKKLLDEQFKDLSKKKWYETIVLWLVDSKYRKYKRVNRFLSDQLRTPPKELTDLANSLKGRTVYDTVHKIERYVYMNFRYETDKSNYNKLEYWASALDTFNIKRGDCDDLNSLIWILCILAGVSNKMLYCVIGNTSGGKHFWVSFFDARRSRMVKLDATFYPEVKTIKQKSEFKIGTKCKSVDYLFNDKKIYAFR